MSVLIEIYKHVFLSQKTLNRKVPKTVYKHYKAKKYIKKLYNKNMEVEK